jgi:cell division transport system permease protein
LGLVLLKSSTVSNRIKEKIVVTLFLKDNVNTGQINAFKDSLAKEDFARRIVYTSKAQAAKKYSKEIGEDFLTFLGENPLKNGIDIYLKAAFVTPGKMGALEARFLKNEFVADVTYDKPLINLLTEHIQRIGFWLFVLSGFLAFVAIILINSAIRLPI